MTSKQLKQLIIQALQKANIGIENEENDKTYKGYASISISGKRVKKVQVSIYLPEHHDGIIADEINMEEQMYAVMKVIKAIVKDIHHRKKKTIGLHAYQMFSGLMVYLNGKNSKEHLAIGLSEEQFSISTEFYPPSYYDEDSLDFYTHLEIFLRTIIELPPVLLPSEEKETEHEEEDKKALEALSKRIRLPDGPSPKDTNRREEESEEKDEPIEQKIIQAFNKLSCQVYLPETIHETFEDFAGYNTVKEHIRSIIIARIKKETWLQKIQQQTRKNPKLPKTPYSILFEGPPGVGKTLMAKIIAKEAQLIMVYLSADQLLSKWVGETEQNIREIFEAIKHFPQQKFLLFFDEIDTIGGKRRSDSRSWERSQLLTLLQWLEGIETSHNYVFVATTNRKEDLDPALLSRFKEIVSFGLPTQQDIIQLLDYYAKHLSKKDKVTLAQQLVGLTPRAIKNLCEIVEQHHILQLKKEDELYPPPLRLYKEIFKEKREDLDH